MKRSFSSITVYCGSSQDTDARYRETAREVGRQLARANVRIVYGGGSVGLMGAVADAALAAGGTVVGVIPEKLFALEIAHAQVSELIVTPTMHERKVKMAELGDAFIALPGGWGTLEELFEVTTLTQLGYHAKPVGLLNAHGYYDHLVAFLGHATDEGFIRPQHRHLINVAPDLEPLLEAMATSKLPALERAMLKRD